MNSPLERSDVDVPLRRTLTLTVGLVFTVTLVGFESLAVATAIPAIQAAFPTGGAYGSVVSAYMLGNIAGTVGGGAAVDRQGPFVPFLAALACFGGALALAAAAPSLELLLAARFLQGIGGGAIAAVAYATIGTAYPEDERGRVFAILSTAWALPGAVGPALAALVTERFGFRMVFAGLLPLVLLALLITLPPLRSLPRSQRTPTAAPVIPATGMILGSLAMLASAELARAHASPVVPAVVVSAGGAVTLVGYRALLRASTPIEPPHLRQLVLLRGLQAFAFFGIDAMIPPLVHDVLGASYALTGAALTATTIAWTSAAWYGERATAPGRERILIATSFGCVGCAGLVLAASAGQSPLPIGSGAPGDARLVWAFVGSALAGLGVGLAYGPLSVAALRHAEPGREGGASGALTLTEVLAIALASGLAGTSVDVLRDTSVAEARGVIPPLLGAAMFAFAGSLRALRVVPR